jgi:hypothetical protein
LAGWKGYTTNLTEQSAEFVISAYHQLWRVEKSFADVQTRSAGPADLSSQARVDPSPPDDRVRRPGGQPLDRTPNGWSIKKFVRAARRYRTIQIRARATDPHRADPLFDDLHKAIGAISPSDGAH